MPGWLSPTSWKRDEYRGFQCAIYRQMVFDIVKEAFLAIRDAVNDCQRRHNAETFDAKSATNGTFYNEISQK